MEKAREYLTLPEDESKKVSQLTIPARRAGDYPSFYESFSLRGISVDRVEPGLIVCTFKVPARLTDRSSNLAPGAIVNMVDEIGYAVLHVEGVPISVSVNMSISYISNAKAEDELEINSKVLGKQGGCSGTLVLFINKRRVCFTASIRNRNSEYACSCLVRKFVRNRYSWQKINDSEIRMDP